MVRVLKAEFSDGERDEAGVVRLKAMPLHQNVEQRHRVTKATLEIGPDAVSNPFEVANRRQHRQDGFDQHPGIPLAAFAGFEVGRMPVFLVKAGVAEHKHLIGDAIDQGLKGGAIVDIGGGAVPANDQPQMVEQHTQLAPDNPAPVRFAFASDLLLTASLTTGMDQLNAKAVDQSDQRRFGHELVDPAPVRVEQPEQARAIRQLRKQRFVVAFQPAIERPIAAAFQGKQQGQGHDFTGIQVGLRMLLRAWHRIIHPAEQFGDKLFGSHGAFLSLVVSQLQV